MMSYMGEKTAVNGCSALETTGFFDFRCKRSTEADMVDATLDKGKGERSELPAPETTHDLNRGN
ncbi:hypothetical protein [Roseibium litorale]|uniref:Uncharacterized protein n=1 Tax=Roseibium litorale TaxID=2803841 RepID=A0ABR9CID0_9HYPH|nr:hypothetical protein [Roseibium litorale]MBD8890493.1 hypothetical protein [Roseibium litorale]